MAKAEFLSAMSHELRTPMNAVVGLTNYLMRQDPRPDQVEMLNTLEFSANNLLSLINDILDFSKIEAGKIDLEEVDFNLHDLIKGVSSSLGTKADDKGIALNYHYDQKLPNWVKGDPTRLSQILNNLVGNALKFTNAKGNVDLNVRLLEDVKGKHQIYFEVVDTGIGIPQDKLDSIFENFTQAASFTTRKYGGTGLGLSITKKLLEIQDSAIQVKSKEGEGSTFYFTLSLGTSEKNNVSKSSVNLRKVEEQKLDGYKVLLVEDNKINQVVAKKFLSMWKMEIDVAENGLIAVEAVQKKKFDIILMDLQMPEMDGFEATRMIRSLGGAYEDLPILALTASAVLEIKSKAFEVGMNDYIMKPFDPDQLFRKIKYYCTPVDKRMTA
ncbi:MAG: response regulator [Bacteroidota bacterium]